MNWLSSSNMRAMPPSLLAALFLVIISGACAGPADGLPATPLAAASSATVPPLPTSTQSPQLSPKATFASTTTATQAAPVQDGQVKLPQDEGSHLSPLEWWYFNGHLMTEDGREFSYHFVTFQSVLPLGLTARVAQLSWADHSKGRHLTAERGGVPILEATPEEFDLPTAEWRMMGNGETYHLSFQAGDYTVELEAASRKPATLHHSTGLVDLGIAGKTYYYSRTNLETSGTVSVSGITYPITGVSWMDHQWGDFTTEGIGWDWLSLNLDDGSDLTISVVREQAGGKHITTYGTYIPADSSAVHLPGSDISLDYTETWTSTGTGAVYPMDWKLRIGSLELDVMLTPVIEEAEFAISSFIPVVYWEGAVAAAGTKAGASVSGRGFVEMVGYAPAALPTPPVQP